MPPGLAADIARNPWKHVFRHPAAMEAWRWIEDASPASPTLIALLCIEWGRPGWFVLGGVIVLASVLMVPASNWALRSRERYGVLTHSG